MGVSGGVARLCTVMVTGAGLAACQTDGANLAPVPDYVSQAIYDEAVAQFIVRKCPQIGKVGQTAQNNYLVLYDKMQTDGHNLQDLERWKLSFPEAELEKRAVAFFASRGVTSVSDPGICRVGREEIAARTMIGRHLRVEQ